MTTLSAASTLGDTWNRLPSGKKSWAPQLLRAGAASPPFRALALAADDPPRGKVLIVEDEAVTALELQRVLRDAGFRTVGPATAMADIQKLIERGAIDCAILDLDVDRRSPLPVADLLEFAEVPFVFLSGGRTTLPTRHRRRPVIEKPFSRAALLGVLEEVMATQKRAANDNLWPGVPATLPWPRVYPSL